MLRFRKRDAQALAALIVLDCFVLVYVLLLLLHHNPFIVHLSKITCSKMFELEFENHIKVLDVSA